MNPVSNTPAVFNDQNQNVKLVQEITKSQIRRCYIYSGMLLFLSGLLLTGGLTGTLTPALYVKTATIPNFVWAIIFFSTGIFFELISASFLKRYIGGAIFFNIIPYLLAIIEVSIPTAILFLISQTLPPGQGLTAAPSFGYSVVIIFSALHLNIRVCIFTGFIAGLAYLTLSMSQIIPYQNHPGAAYNLLVEPAQHVLKSIFLVITGVIMAFVTYEIKTRLINSFKDRHKRMIEVEKNAALAETFQKFVPKQLLDRIASKGIENIEIGVAGTSSYIVLFSDIRGFTPLAELLKPSDLLHFLNTYFHKMNAVINKHHGFVDQFVGDAIKALFGNSEKKQLDNVENAIQAAIDMQKEICLINRPDKDSDTVALEVGIGIHCGSVVVGTVGAEDRMDSAVLGEVVNISSRLESLTKQYGVKIIVSEKLLDLVDDKSRFQLRLLDFVKVKGATKPLNIFEIYDCESKHIQGLKNKSAETIAQGLDYRFKQDWDRARSKFNEALACYPEDSVAKFHLSQLDVLIEKTFPQNWDGAVELNK